MRIGKTSPITTTSGKKTQIKMIDVTEIPAILSPVIEVKKKLIKRSYKKDEQAEYFKNYQLYCDWREAISYHTVKGKKPVKMLEKKAPCQSQQELDYVLANYKQITLPVSFEFLSTIGRGLHDSNWSIDFPEEKSEYVNAEFTFKKYLDEDIAQTPLKMSYDSWMKFVLPSLKINDAMGVIAYKPWVEEKVVIVNDVPVLAGDVLPEPIPFYYSCDRVLTPTDSKYVLIETPRFSTIEKQGRKVKEGLVFELYDENAIYIIEQTGKYSDWEFVPRVYFTHNFGFIPVTYLKGISQYDDDGMLYYQSPFLLVTDILDLALMDGCMLQSVKAASVYPQKVMVGNECMFSETGKNAMIYKCQNGYIPNEDNQGFHKCPECLGSGLAQRTGPLNTILTRPRSAINEGDPIKPTDALAFIYPDVGIPKYLREEINNAILNGLSILHLKTTNTVVQGAEDMTATGMVMDEKGKYAFIKSIVDQIFDIYEFGMKCMGMMRYGKDFVEPVIQRPISYDFNSEGDYLVQISAAQTAGAPPVIIASYVYKYLKAIFYDNPQTAKAYDLIIAADRIFTMTKEQIQYEVGRNLIEPWQVVLHDSSLTFVSELVRDNPEFLNQEMDVMIESLQSLAKENTPATIAVSPRLTPASILENANA